MLNDYQRTPCGFKGGWAVLPLSLLRDLSIFVVLNCCFRSDSGSGPVTVYVQRQIKSDRGSTYSVVINQHVSRSYRMNSLLVGKPFLWGRRCIIITRPLKCTV